MLKFFDSVFDSASAAVISLSDFLLCIACTLVIGIALALCCMYRSRYTKSFIVTLALLPAVVCVVIMMVNGNIGAGVAVAGAFSLVRFRSAQGTAKEITMLFLAMSTGLICAMGYLGYALLFTIIMCAVSVIYTRLDFGASKSAQIYKVLTVTIPENLDYSQIFDDILESYTSSHELIKVKTTNMGSLIKLTYNISLKDFTKEKEMIDKLRCRNGNLEISVSKQDTFAAEL